MSSSANPTVSVVMNVFNTEAFLAEAVGSILAQIFTDFEFLIVNDGSTDRSGEIADAFARNDSRIRVLHQENHGIAAAANHGLAQARGRYVARMDADDVALPDRFAKQVAFLDSHPEVAVVGGAIECIDQSGRPKFVVQYPVDPQEVRMRLPEGSFVANPTAMMRRELAIAVGSYRLAFPQAEDYDLWLRMSERAEIANLADVVLRHRRHGGNITHVRTLENRESTILARASARARSRGAVDPVDELTGFPDDFVERFASVGEDSDWLHKEAGIPLLLRALARRDYAAADQLLRRLRRAEIAGTDRELLIARIVNHAMESIRAGRWMQALHLIGRALRLSRKRTFRRVFHAGAAANPPLARSIKNEP